GRGRGPGGAVRDAANLGQGPHRRVEIPALDRIRRRAAEDGDREDPAVQIARGWGVTVWGGTLNGTTPAKAGAHSSVRSVSVGLHHRLSRSAMPRPARRWVPA